MYGAGSIRGGLWVRGGSRIGLGGSEIGPGAGVTPEERSGWFGAGSR